MVYVDDFSGQSPTGWAQGTVRASDLGGYDALLAVATTSRAYAFLVPSTIKSVNSGQVDSLRRNKIEPALHNGDWGGAAVAAANGLDASPGSSGRVILLATLAGILIALAGLLLVMRHRGQRRRAAALAAARRVDPTDVDALAALPLQTLDDLSRALVVDVDNALRTSANRWTWRSANSAKSAPDPSRARWPTPKRLCPKRSRCANNSTTPHRKHPPSGANCSPR